MKTKNIILCVLIIATSTQDTGATAPSVAKSIFAGTCIGAVTGFTAGIVTAATYGLITKGIIPAATHGLEAKAKQKMLVLCNKTLAFFIAADYFSEFFSRHAIINEQTKGDHNNGYNKTLIQITAQGASWLSYIIALQYVAPWLFKNYYKKETALEALWNSTQDAISYLANVQTT